MGGRTGLYTSVWWCCGSVDSVGSFILSLFYPQSCDSHVTRTTQYENPVSTAKRMAAGQMVSQLHDRPMMHPTTAPPPIRDPPSWASTAALQKQQDAEAAQWWPEAAQYSHPVNQYPSSGGYGYDEDLNRVEINLGGEVIRTVLMKNHQGFGFTIIGGDQRGDLLRIKSIVPGSVADRDGRLATGDIIVRINGTSVLSLTHQEVVDLFHSLPLHSNVMVEVRRTEGMSRGYDNNEPTHQPPLMNNSVFGSNSASLDRGSHMVDTGVKGEVKVVSIVKGPAGFGFSVVETPEGHVVKQIMDQLRCADLRVSI